MREGFSDAAGVSFESFSQPGKFLMLKGIMVDLMPVESEEDRVNATFYIEQAE